MRYIKPVRTTNRLVKGGLRKRQLQRVEHSCGNGGWGREGGFKASPRKVQLGLQEVTYLGQTIGTHGRALTQERTQALRLLPQPTTVTGLRQVMGLANYCRSYVPDFGELVAPLQRMLKGGKPGIEKLEWGPEEEEAFTGLKEELSQAPALRLPDARKPFHLWFWVGEHTYSCALGQKQADGKTGMVGYYSTPIAATMTGQHRVNPASFLVEERTPHQCAAKIEYDCMGHLQREPLPSPDLTLFVDGSSFYKNGVRKTGWAVVNQAGETEAAGIYRRGPTSSAGSSN
ncbi:hypothetical protein SKAU_G00020490 [Synaphobranchus kaupii]|uniref:Reverse transcriptase/retrotransposon-derived protein RNase H-like domain-containing protein n=1 Tax=Synaphobranchus kaupii TaxID=118154 RepID=A0A9Q1GBP6_SYNKA|nr:hypothetical protein SKAU_G00020490 [Synaphobranchus kaupii]